MKQFALNMLETLNFDENLGFFFTLMLSKNDEFIWQYKNKRIGTFQQLEIFIKKFIEDYLNLEDEANSKILSKLFISIFKFVRH